MLIAFHERQKDLRITICMVTGITDIRRFTFSLKKQHPFSSFFYGGLFINFNFTFSSILVPVKLPFYSKTFFKPVVAYCSLRVCCAPQLSKSERTMFLVN